VEGHTDDVPIENKRFPSNWELSVARAVNVVKYFISKGNISPERLSAAGYGDSKPLYPNVSDHNRELNRRVGIILTLREN
jgi:chemotaxis protein MotB